MSGERGSQTVGRGGAQAGLFESLPGSLYSLLADTLSAAEIRRKADDTVRVKQISKRLYDLYDRCLAGGASLSFAACGRFHVHKEV